MNMRKGFMFLTMVVVVVMLRGAQDRDKISAESVNDIVVARTGRGNP